MERVRTAVKTGGVASLACCVVVKALSYRGHWRHTGASCLLEPLFYFHASP